MEQLSEPLCISSTCIQGESDCQNLKPFQPANSFEGDQLVTSQVKRKGGPEVDSNLVVKDGDDYNDEADKDHLSPVLAHHHCISQVIPREVFQDLAWN